MEVDAVRSGTIVLPLLLFFACKFDLFDGAGVMEHGCFYSTFSKLFFFRVFFRGFGFCYFLVW